MESAAPAVTAAAKTADPNNPTETMSPQDLVGIPPLPKTETQVSEVLQPVPEKPVPEKYSLVDEVWALVNKFYIDRTFHGQVRAK